MRAVWFGSILLFCAVSRLGLPDYTTWLPFCCRDGIYTSNEEEACYFAGIAVFPPVHRLPFKLKHFKLRCFRRCVSVESGVMAWTWSIFGLVMGYEDPPERRLYRLV